MPDDTKTEETKAETKVTKAEAEAMVAEAQAAADAKAKANTPSPRTKPQITMSDEPIELSTPKPKLSSRTQAEMKRGREAISR